MLSKSKNVETEGGDSGPHQAVMCLQYNVSQKSVKNLVDGFPFCE